MVVTIQTKVSAIKRKEYKYEFMRKAEIGDVYLEARDWKSNGNLSGASIMQVIYYDANAIMYAANAMSEVDLSKDLDK